MMPLLQAPRHLGLLLTVLICLYGLTPAAWAQPSVKTDDLRLTDSNGCILYHPTTDAVQQVQLRNTGKSASLPIQRAYCPDKVHHDSIIYGLGWRVQDNDGVSREGIGMRVGWLKDGRFAGLRLYLNQGGYLFLLDETGKSILSTRRSDPNYSLPSILDKIQKETVRLEALDKQFLARFNIEWLSEVLHIWDQNPWALMQAYTDDISGPMLANPGARQIDAPKTAGRGAVPPEELQRQAEERRLGDEQHAENQRRIQENQARRQREKEELEARKLKEMTEALQQLSNSLGNLRRK
jgi:hypothetical protein